MTAAYGQKVSFALIDEDGIFQYNVNTPSNVDNISLLNVVDGCILVGGTYCMTEKKINGMVKGLFGMSYNMKTGKLEGSDFRDLSEKDLSVLFNRKLGKRVLGYCNPLSVVSQSTTSYGGVLALSLLEHVVIQNSNGASNEYFTRTGLLAFAVDKKGKMLWEYPIRHYEKAGNPISFSQPMVSDGDNVYLFHIEDCKSLPIYNLDKAQKKKNALGNSCDLVVYGFNENGMTGKNILVDKQKGFLDGSTQDWMNDHYYLMYVGNKKSGLVTITKPR